MHLPEEGDVRRPENRQGTKPALDHGIAESAPRRTWTWTQTRTGRPFAAASGVPRENARKAAEAIGARLSQLSPEQDEAMLKDAGFSGISLFYAGFTFRGWVAFNRS